MKQFLYRKKTLETPIFASSSVYCISMINTSQVMYIKTCRFLNDDWRLFFNNDVIKTGKLFDWQGQKTRGAVIIIIIVLYLYILGQHIFLVHVRKSYWLNLGDPFLKLGFQQHCSKSFFVRRHRDCNLHKRKFRMKHFWLFTPSLNIISIGAAGCHILQFRPGINCKWIGYSIFQFTQLINSNCY